jgi:hypothetical protein
MCQHRFATIEFDVNRASDGKTEFPISARTIGCD